MKLYNNPKFAGTTIRKVKTNDGKPVALIGTCEDLYATGIFTKLPVFGAWEWCIAYMDGKCEVFDSRDELLVHLKEAVA